MSISDVIKSSFLEGFAVPDMSAGKIAVSLGITVLLGVFIYFIYRLQNRSAFYSKQFNLTLPLMAIVTAAIVLAMQSNIVISLGMVGALSIVRFRTAVKEPLDLLYLFWAISVGIICGAGLYLVAVIVSAVVTLAVFLLGMIPAPKAPYLLVVNASDTAIEEKLMKTVAEYAKNAKIKSRSMTASSVELIVELSTKNAPALTAAVGKVEGITTLTLMNHDGELRG